MKYRFIFLLSFLFALLQGPFLPAVFLEGFLFALLFVDKKQMSTGILLRLFASGFLFDLFQGKLLGITPLILGVGGIIFSQWSVEASKRPVLLATLAALVDLGRSRIVFGQFLLVPSLLCFLITYLFLTFTWRSHALGVGLGEGRR